MNPYESPKTGPEEPEEKKYMSNEEWKQMILNHPNSGPLAKFSVTWPKTFWTIFLTLSVGGIIAFKIWVGEP